MTLAVPDRLVLKGGTIAAGPDEPARTADVAVAGDRILEIGRVTVGRGDHVIDCSGRTVMPGFIDAHCHADGMIFEPHVQLAMLRQGVTTVITGHDGVGFAPGSGRYASDYFGALNGRHPDYDGGGVAALLSSYDGRVAVNVGYLVPAGTVRQEVVGSDSRGPSAGELVTMVGLVDRSMGEGALGLSTGLDYIPGIFASTAELTALCRPVARYGGVHASHMRGGYEHASPAGVAELREIARRSRVRTHVSHFHADASQVRGLMDEAQSDGEFSFDAYPYRRGCTLLGMPLLPPDLLAEGAAATLAEIVDPQRRAALAERWGERVAAQPSFGDRWASMCTLVHVAAPRLAWAVGMTVDAAAAKSGEDPLVFGYRLLAESRLDVRAVVASPTRRRWDELAGIFTHPRHMAGSDGIWFGQHPHPRGWGTFARFLRISMRERGDWDVPAAVAHLSANAADTFRLGLRGRIRPGWVADLAVVDVATVTDQATYENPKTVATGIDDVLVAGVPVLADGRLTGQRPGRGSRRQPPVLTPSPPAAALRGTNP